MNANIRLHRQTYTGIALCSLTLLHVWRSILFSCVSFSWIFIQRQYTIIIAGDFEWPLAIKWSNERHINVTLSAKYQTLVFTPAGYVMLCYAMLCICDLGID